MTISTFKYAGVSGVQGTSKSSTVSFMPDLLRPPTYFRGSVGQRLLFREAISALHKVVTGDTRYTPPDKSAYLEWRKNQEQIELARIREELLQAQSELDVLRGERDAILSGFKAFFDGFENVVAQRAHERIERGYRELKDRVGWRRYMEIMYDPVITVHPDELFFECFSIDESSYGKLSMDYQTFANIGEFECGTTNVDYSYALYDAFQKIRTYKTTDLVVDPGGFTVETQGEDAFHEKKIDLPETWVKGFAQVSAAMNLPASVVRLHPTDIVMICQYLRKRKEKVGPRSLRFLLKPREPVSVVFDPWNENAGVIDRSTLVTKSKRSVFGVVVDFMYLKDWYPSPIILICICWGEVCHITSVVPLQEKPVFNASTSSMTFTLGLSSWSTNKPRGAAFDLMQSKVQVPLSTMTSVYNCLKKKCNWTATPADISKKLGLDEETVRSSLFAYANAGYVVYDSNKQLFRARELFKEGPKIENIFEPSPAEKLAQRLIDSGSVQGFRIQGTEAKKITGYVRDYTESESLMTVTLSLDPTEIDWQRVSLYVQILYRK